MNGKTHVSILVILELALEAFARKKRWWHPSVSILVILELALEVLMGSGGLMRYSCFNPCYSGIGFRSMRIFTLHIKNYSFNPCYSGIGFRSMSNELEYIVKVLFQSLLFWNWLQKGQLRLPYSIECPVSILVILELALEV